MDTSTIIGYLIGASPWALATLILAALIRGDLVPRRTHQDACAQRDMVIRELTDDRDFYRSHTLQLMGVVDRQADIATRSLLQARRQPESEPTL